MCTCHHHKNISISTPPPSELSSHTVTLLTPPSMSCCCRIISEGEGPASYQLEATSFIKTVEAHDLRDGRLEIPETFAMKHGDWLPDSIFLKVPNGMVWPIELGRGEGRVWLHKGWKEFTQLYSLNCGYLLTFISEGRSSHFQVRIFKNGNTSEINYCPFSSISDEEQNVCEGSGGNMSNARRRSSSPKASFGDANQQLKDLKARAFSRAKMFTSDKPFVVIKMCPTYMTRLKMHESFAKKHICHEGSCEVTLQISDERTWTVGCNMNEHNGRAYARFTAAWKAFVRDNDLTEVDTCVFEVLEDRKFRVWIFRARDEIDT